MDETPENLPRQTPDGLPVVESETISTYLHDMVMISLDETKDAPDSVNRKRLTAENPVLDLFLSRTVRTIDIEPLGIHTPEYAEGFLACYELLRYQARLNNIVEPSSQR